MIGEKQKLKDVCVKITKGTTPSTYGFPFIESGINYVKAESILEGGGILPNTFAYIDEATHEYLKRSILCDKDILVSIAGAKLGKCGFLTEEYLPANTNQAVGIVRVDQNNADPKFVYYNFVNNHTYQIINSLNSQAAQPNLNLGQLGELEFKFPPLPIQRRIASILSAYDDLIENNLKRIKLLEEKAFLSYKLIVKSEKFVEKKLIQTTQFLKRGISPKYVNEEGVIVLNQKCIRNHIVSFEDSRLTDFEKGVPAERMLQKFDTLINSTGTGTLGRIAMNIQDDFPLTADSHITIVRANHEITPIYLCMSLFAKENVIEMMGEGATNQTELSPKKIGEEIKIPLVSNALMNEYEQTALPIFNLIWNLQKQNTKLREARDILLPRLMSGEIEV